MTEKGEYAYMRATPDAIEWLKRLVSDESKVIICHNAKFELMMMSRAFGIDIFSLLDNGGAKFECTQIMSKVLNSTSQTHDLETCGARFLGRDTSDKTSIAAWVKSHNTKRLVKERGRKLNFSDAPDDLVKRRVLWDVETTLMLYFFFAPRVR